MGLVEPGRAFRVRAWVPDPAHHALDVVAGRPILGLECRTHALEVVAWPFLGLSPLLLSGFLERGHAVATSSVMKA